MVKKSGIKIIENKGTFQLAINNHCVTGYDHKSADDCYKSYITKLLNKLKKVEEALLKILKRY